MLAAVLAACAFAGCGGNGQPANPTPDANEVWYLRVFTTNF